MDWRGTGRPNPSREAKFLARTGTGKHYFPCSADHEQDWQPYPVDEYSAESAEHTYMVYVWGVNEPHVFTFFNQTFIFTGSVIPSVFR